MIYFTADLHFGHRNILKLCERPFTTVEEMDMTLTRNWNAVVHKRDEVYILGDFTMLHSEAAYNYLTRLKGRKYFIRGNHDQFLNNIEKFAEYDRKLGEEQSEHDAKYGAQIEWVKDYHILKHRGRKFVLFHYPIAEWDGLWRGAIHLFGHVHRNPPALPNHNSALAFNVGVDEMIFVL